MRSYACRESKNPEPDFNNPIFLTDTNHCPPLMSLPYPCLEIMIKAECSFQVLLCQMLCPCHPRLMKPA